VIEPAALQVVLAVLAVLAGSPDASSDGRSDRGNRFCVATLGLNELIVRRRLG
jgi:hypothetical protein